MGEPQEMTFLSGPRSPYLLCAGYKDGVFATDEGVFCFGEGCPDSREPLEGLPRDKEVLAVLHMRRFLVVAVLEGDDEIWTLEKMRWQKGVPYEWMRDEVRAWEQGNTKTSKEKEKPKCFLQ